MSKHLCIHGHFYQPPREDPWLGLILPEGSAAPQINWNQRICRESYAPISRARRLDSQGRIAEIMNLYEWISFNAGPTMMNWLAQAEPETCRRMVEADRASLDRLGHGNAMAQVYHHQIMPLATELDKELEVAWAVDDFVARFGSAPEGMWLAEAAVDIPSLEVLARHGVIFTVLAPGQARQVAPLDGGSWTDAHPDSLDITQPYRVSLPSGRPMSVFFYDGPLSQAVAFEGLLSDGSNFFRRIADAARPGLTSLATDGETYGHHFTFGEMALAYVLDQARQGARGLTLTNFAAYLAAHPPTRQVRLHEPSSWSCAHGVERWRSDCGCTSGGHAGWRQTWRGPLRQALQGVKSGVDQHFFRRGATVFTDPMKALIGYGKVLAKLCDQESFEAAHLRPGLGATERTVAWKLLAMQQWGLASMASCAWFFDEIARIEPINAMTYALRSMELAQATGAPDLEGPMLAALKDAPSNLPEYGDGRTIFNTLVRPRRESLESLAAQALLTLWAEERLPAPEQSAQADWPGVRVSVRAASLKDGEFSGGASVRWNLESGAENMELSWRLPESGDPLAHPVRARFAGGREAVFHPRSLPQNKRQALANAWVTRAEESLWRESVRRMECGAHFIDELQDGQNTLTLAPRWAGLWPALVWSYVWGLDLGGKRQKLLTLYLHKTPRPAESCRELTRRIGLHALAELETGSPDWDRLCRLVARMREIGLPEDWWAVQNRLWETGLFQGPGRTFAGLIGMGS
ncbi:DUF3536 domain-containing protein [Fundidesulfovibrio butyratiphilus]